jgi:succinate dehydrogenase / fumarate reductase, cytochrome b subunit
LEPPALSSFFGRYSFLIYRLFSLTGIIPIGGYVIIHLLTNATVLNGPGTFQAQVDRIHSLGIILPLVEWVFIFLPLIFHASIGIFVISTGLPNTNSYPYTSNIRYTLQRATGIIAFFFIIWHVIHMHSLFGGPFEKLGGAQFDAHHATSSTAGAIQAALWVQVLYAIGVLASVYHLANGIWTFGITWGIWVRPAAMRRAAYICLVFGILLAGAGLSALVGFSRIDADDAAQLEQRMEEQRKLYSGEPVEGE